MKNTYIILTLFILVVVIAGVWALNHYEKIDLKLFLPKEQQTEGVFSVVGKVESINSQGFVLRATAEQNNFSKNRVFEVAVSNETNFSGLDSPQAISQEDIHKPILAHSSNFADLKTGDEVSVVSKINITDANSFEAVSVQISRIISSGE